MFQCVVEVLRVLYFFSVNSHWYFKGSESGFLKDQSTVNHWYSPYQRSICEAGAICWFTALVSFRSLLNKDEDCILLSSGNIITFMNHLARLLVHNKLPSSHFKIYYFNVQILFCALAGIMGRKHCLLEGPDCMNIQYLPSPNKPWVFMVRGEKYLPTGHDTVVSISRSSHLCLYLDMELIVLIVTPLTCEKFMVKVLLDQLKNEIPYNISLLGGGGNKLPLYFEFHL